MNTPTLALPGLDSGGETRFFSLGRHALAEALRMLPVGPGDEVLVPEFICRDLLAALHAAQASPVYYAVDRLLACAPLPRSPRVKAVVAVNYFGFPQDLEPFRAYCARNDACLIEDNAHGLLSRDASGALLGTRGDLGVFSMRKTFALPDGAALLLNRTNWREQMPPQLDCMDDSPAAGFVVKRALSRVQSATGVRVRSFAEQVVRQARRLRTGSPLPLPQPDSEQVIPGEPAISCETLRMLGQVCAASEVDRRRNLFLGFQRDLRSRDIEHVFRDLPSGVAPYGYAFRSGESEGASIARMARKAGFDCGRWPDLPAAVAARAPAHYRDVWWVNFLC